MSFECSICIVEYDEDDHRPMVGSCGHTVCSTCVRSREPCPICRTSHAFAQLVTNFEILRLARENGKLKEELGEFEKLEMENLDSQELSFIITSLRHCMHCDQKVQFGEIGSKVCGCIKHLDNKCPSPRVREEHSPCDNSRKLELITIHMNQLFPNETILNGFRRIIAQNCPNLLLFMFGSKDSDDFTNEELWLMSCVWRICALCSTKIAEKKIRYRCGCLAHDGDCPSKKKRKHSQKECSSSLKKEILADFVRTSYPGESVLSAFVQYMEKECPGIIEIIKQDQILYENVKLTKENDRLKEEIAQNTRLEADIENLKTEREADKQQMKNETQKLVQELEGLRKELTKSEENRKSSDQKWEEVCNKKQSVCDELEAENKTLKEEHREEHLCSKKEEDKMRQQFAQILEEMEGQTEHFKQKWTGLQEKYNQLEQVNKRLEADVPHLRDKKGMMKEQALEKSDDMANDEFMLNIEMNSFQPLFNEIQHKVTELGKRIFSVRNNQTRRELTQKLTPATDISCEVEETVVTVLKNEGDKLQTALDLLLSLETEFPSASSNQGGHPGDARLLD